MWLAALYVSYMVVVVCGRCAVQSEYFLLELDRLATKPVAKHTLLRNPLLSSYPILSTPVASVIIGFPSA